MFLRNHDELTLEMVTDEERDYMYRVYANDPRARINLGIRRRLAPLLANSRRKIELLNILLFSMPGTPVLYYGDEIGMGDNFYLGDRNGVRTPMQWSPDRNAGFSKANPQQLYLPITIDPEYHYEAVNVENQQKNLVLASLVDAARDRDAEELQSVLARLARVSASGKREGARLSSPARRRDHSRRGESLALLPGGRDRSLALCRLLPHGGLQSELFPGDQGNALSDHARTACEFLVCSSTATGGARASQERVVPSLNAAPVLRTLLDDGQRTHFEREILPEFIRDCRWFGAKARAIRELRIAERVPVPGKGSAQFWFVEITYTDGNPETYALPVQIANGEAAHAIAHAAPHAVIARFAGGEEAILHDAIWDAAFREQLFRAITQRRIWKENRANCAACPVRRCPRGQSSDFSGPRCEQSNSSMLFENKFFLKLYRKLEDGVNPDVEITRFLTEKRNFPHVPAFAGAIEYRRAKTEPTVVCLLQTAAPTKAMPGR